MIDIIIIVILAGFLVLRLWGVLGKRIGYEGKNPVAKKKNREKEVDVKKEKSTRLICELAKEEQVTNKLLKLVEEQENFQLVEFLKKAEAAVEAVIIGHTGGDKESLKGLVTLSLARRFNEDIDQRASDATEEKTEVVGVNVLKIEDVITSKQDTTFVLLIETRIIKYRQDKEGVVVPEKSRRAHVKRNLWYFINKKLLSSEKGYWRVAQIEAIPNESS